MLELERAEDIDVVEMLGDSPERTLTQVKHRNKNLTLRSSEALEAIVNFFEHRQENPEQQLTFRFITNAEVSIECLHYFQTKPQE
ncbi:hypothetical protein J2W98_004698 [Paenibacillus peoriae]|uniref:Uncharacterized protein n=1 Tax=Paenibacillus peoriae TaxID=59893 RepID=A0ABU1QL87_9BACL|nr:hypothetical protein [Paenibacillus peoriae]MDR6780403.1 hypothetical protein [Paenibacillus peoriae]